MAALATKKCAKCGETKAVEQFPWKIKAKGKRDSRCKVCRSADAKKYQQEHREEVLARKRQYREANREAINARNRQYREANREEINARKREHWEENRDEINAQQRTPEARARHNATARARYATEEGKLLVKTRKLHRCFYTGELGSVRLPRAEALVGCTRKDYRDHLASMFKDGMTHENYGQGTDKWQIDHVIPKAAFKGELEANLQVIYWWGNTQPLWGLENTAKGNKYTEEGKQALICRYQAWISAGKPPPVH